jgi:hypothetical protein
MGRYRLYSYGILAIRRGCCQAVRIREMAPVSIGAQSAGLEPRCLARDSYDVSVNDARPYYDRQLS